MAEEYFSRLRRAEIGIHHHIAGAHPPPLRSGVLREDNRRFSNGDQLKRITAPGLPRQFASRLSNRRRRGEEEGGAGWRMRGRALQS
jgi:hypothetical protein